MQVLKTSSIPLDHVSHLEAWKMVQYHFTEGAMANCRHLHHFEYERTLQVTCMSQLAMNN